MPGIPMYLITGDRTVSLPGVVADDIGLEFWG